MYALSARSIFMGYTSCGFILSGSSYSTQPGVRQTWRLSSFALFPTYIGHPTDPSTNDPARTIARPSQVPDPTHPSPGQRLKGMCGEGRRFAPPQPRTVVLLACYVDGCQPSFSVIGLRGTYAASAPASGPTSQRRCTRTAR